MINWTVNENIPVTHIKLVVRDEKEMFITFCKINDEKIISQTAIGIWNLYSEFVETISGVYNFIWTTELFNNLKIIKSLKKS